MTYTEYKNARQGEFNALPIFWAFSNRQFEEAMQERGLTMNDTDKIFFIGAGGFALKSDKDAILAFLKKEDPLPEMMKDPAFAEDAFFYEMCNHIGHIRLCCFFRTVLIGDYGIEIECIPCKGLAVFIIGCDDPVIIHRHDLFVIRFRNFHCHRIRLLHVHAQVQPAQIIIAVLLRHSPFLIVAAVAARPLDFERYGLCLR